MVKKFISYYHNHRKVFFLDMISALLMSGIDLIYPIALRTILNVYIPDDNLRFIIYLGVGLLILYLIRARLSFCK